MKRFLALAVAALAFLPMHPAAQTTGVPSVGSLNAAINGTASAPAIGRGSSGTYFSGAGGSILHSIGGTAWGRWDSNHNFFWGNLAGTSLTSGTSNFLAGSRSGYSLTSAVGEICIGLDACFYRTTGAGSNAPVPSVVLGYTAAKFLGSAGDGGNVAIGASTAGALSPYAFGAQLGYSFTAVGEYALAAVGASQKDTAVGSYALTNYLRGGQNVALGRGAATNLVESAYGIFVGHAPAFKSVAATELICIGNSACDPWNSGAPPRFTGVQASGVLTVSSFNVGDSAIAVGMVCVSTTATALPSNITIVSFGTGSGGNGTYNVTPSQTVSSQAMRCGASNTNNINIGGVTGSLDYASHDVIAIGYGVKPKTGSNITVIGTGQTAATISGYLASKQGNVSVANAGNVTYTTTQLQGGFINRSGATSARTDVTPTAAQIVAAIPGAEVDTGYRFTIANNNTASGSVTLSAGTGVTVTMGTPVIAGDRATFHVKVTNIGSGTEAVEITEMFRSFYSDGNIVAAGSVTAASGVVSTNGQFIASSASRLLMGTDAEVTMTNTGITGAFTALRLGFASATPGAVTLFGQPSRSGTDTNTAGGNLTVTAGLGTGTATPSTLNLASPVAVASGTGAQTQTTGLRINRGTFASTGFTVATLPATPLTGARAHVTDAAACTFGSAPSGGGSTFCPVVYDGAAWLAGG